MKKALFVPLSNKEDTAIERDMQLSPQQRVDRMFDLIDVLINLQKEYILPHKENCITLKRTRGTLPE